MNFKLIFMGISMINCVALNSAEDDNKLPKDYCVKYNDYANDYMNHFGLLYDASCADKKTIKQLEKLQSTARQCNSSMFLRYRIWSTLNSFKKKLKDQERAQNVRDKNKEFEKQYNNEDSEN